MEEYIVWAEYGGRAANICGAGFTYADKDEALEVAQNFLWDMELSKPEVGEDLKVSIVPVIGDEQMFDRAEPVEI